MTALADRFPNAALWIAAAALSLALLPGGSPGPREALDRANAPMIDFHHYAEIGEMLSHGVDSPGKAVSQRMPLAALGSSVYLAHGEENRGAAGRALTLAGIAALTFSLGTILLSPACGAGGTVLFLIFAPIGFRHDWSHFFAANEIWQFLPFFLLVANLLALAARDGGRRIEAALACAVGASLLHRSELSLFPILLALWTLSRRKPTDSAMPAAAAAVVPFLFVLPFVHMNWTVVREFLPFEAEAADEGLVRGAAGLVRYAAGSGSWGTHAMLGPGFGEGAAAWFLAETLRHPLAAALTSAQRLLLIFRFFPLTAAAGLCGLWLHRRDPAFRAAALLLGFFTFMHLLLPLNDKYMLPILPVLCVFTAAAAVRGAERLRKRTPAEPGASWKTGGTSRRFAEGAVAAAFAAAMVLSLYAAALTVRYARLARGGEITSMSRLDAEILRRPRDPWLRSLRGRRALAAGRAERAVDDFRKAAALRPWDAYAALDLAWALRRLGETGPLAALAIEWRDKGEDDPRFSLVRIGFRVAASLPAPGTKGPADRERLAEALEIERTRMIAWPALWMEGADAPDPDIRISPAASLYERILNSWGALLTGEDREALVAGLAEASGLGDRFVRFEERRGSPFSTTSTP